MWKRTLSRRGGEAQQAPRLRHGVAPRCSGVHGAPRHLTQGQRGTPSLSGVRQGSLLLLCVWEGGGILRHDLFEL